jgi:NCAIR mutase (PurE)-related protein
MKVIQTTKEMLKLRKADLALEAREDAQQLMNHNDASVVLAQIAKMQVYLNEMADELKDQAIEEIHQEQRETMHDVMRYGVKMIVANGRDTLDYEKDEVYKKLNQALKDRRQELSAAHKAHFKDGKIFADSETGETVPIVPVKSGGGIQVRKSVL